METTIKLGLINFGAFQYESFDLVSQALPNGGGKTTIVNAYLFALTGKCLNGFKARRAAAPPCEITSVTLMAGRTIRRTLKDTGETTLYVDDELMTQTEFNALCMSEGIDLGLVSACANVNLLTNSDLSSEALRSLLSVSGVMDGERLGKLKKQAEKLRKQATEAERYALTNVIEPPRTVEPLSVSESHFLSEYADAVAIEKCGCSSICESCGQALPPFAAAQVQDRYIKACRIIEDRRAEANRLETQKEAYRLETQKIEDARRLIDAAKNARADAVRYKKMLSDVIGEIRDIENEHIQCALPPGVEIITEETSKTGVKRSVCTLTYNGVPLKSVNRAERIRICAEILNGARDRKGMKSTPIIIDNAEALSAPLMIPHVVYLSVLNINN